MQLSIKYVEIKPDIDRKEGLPFGKALKETLKNKAFVIYVIAAFFLQFTFVFMQAAMPFYVKYVLKAGSLEQSLVLGTVFISALFFVLAWGKVSSNKGAKWTMLVCIFLFALSLIPYWFAQNYLAGLIIAALNGFGLAGLMILLDVMLADIIDLDQLKTGQRREGMYFGMNALIIRLGISIQGPLLGYILTKSGYVAEALEQSASALTGLKISLVVVPIVALVLSFVFYLLYPLNKKEVDQIKEDLENTFVG